MGLREMLFGSKSYATYMLSDDIADIMNRGCWWEKLPKTIMALEQLANNAKEKNFELTQRIVTRSNIPKNRGCKDPDVVFGE
jgi:hypothetical protein